MLFYTRIVLSFRRINELTNCLNLLYIKSSLLNYSPILLGIIVLASFIIIKNIKKVVKINEFLYYFLFFYYKIHFFLSKIIF